MLEAFILLFDTHLRATIDRLCGNRFIAIQDFEKYSEVHCVCNLIGELENETINLKDFLV